MQAQSSIVRDLPLDFNRTGLKALFIADKTNRALFNALPLNATTELITAAFTGARAHGWDPVLVGEYVEAPIEKPTAQVFRIEDYLPVAGVVGLAAEILDNLDAGYKSLNGAAARAPALAVGDTEVWYAKSTLDLGMGAEWCRKHGCLPKAEQLSDTHVLLGKVDSSNMSRIYDALQGEVWSPRGEAVNLIKGLGLSHTSMSTGDVLVVSERTFMVDSRGFEELEPEAYAEAAAAGSRGWSASGAARAAADAETAAAAGIVLPPPVYALGSLLRGDGVERAAELRREYEELPPAKQAMLDLAAEVDAEDRQDLPARLADLRLTNAIALQVPTEDGPAVVRVEHDALRKLTRELRVQLGMDDDLGVVGLAKCREPELKQAAAAVWNRASTALGKREDAIFPVKDKAPEQKRLVIRTRVSSRNGSVERQAFALVSEAYGEVDVNRIALACSRMQGINDLRAAVHYDRRGLSVDLLTHTTVPPDQQVAGETFRAGVRITTRDDGTGGLRVRAIVTRNLCLNVIIIHAGEGASTVIKHVGDTVKLVRRLNDALAAASRVVNTFARQWNTAALTKIVSRVEAAQREDRKKLEELVTGLQAAHDQRRSAEHERLGQEILGGVYRGLLVDHELAGKKAADDLVKELLASHWDPRNESGARSSSAAEATTASVANGLTLWAQSQRPERANEIEVLAGEVVAGTVPMVWRSAV